MSRKLGAAFLAIILVAGFNAAAKGNRSDIPENSLARLICVDTMPGGTLQSYLSTANLATFYGHPVDSFLTSIPSVAQSSAISPCKNDRIGRTKACVLQVQYATNLIVEIFVREFTHMNPYLSGGAWDLALFRQEPISSIRVFVNNDCVNGDCN